jgi:predicted kinase
MIADVILLTGAPGTGKSTMARALAASCPKAVHLHTDDFWRAIVSGGIPPYLPEADAQNQVVMRVIRAAAWSYAAGGYTVVVDGVLGPWMLEHFRGPAGRAGETPRAHYVVLRAGRDETLRRARARTAPDALVDEEPLVAMWEQFAELGERESHVIDTTRQDAAATLAAVRAAIESGRLVL